MREATERYRRDLANDAELVQRVLQSFPAAPGDEKTRIITTLVENIDAALARDLAPAAVCWENWQIEIITE